MSRVALWVGGHVEDRLAAELVGASHVLAQRVKTIDELSALVAAGEIEIAVVTATPQRLTLRLIDACDMAGIRLVAIIGEDADRRHALTMDFQETCRADASWESMMQLLRPPIFDTGGIPELAFFDITIDAPPIPLPLVQEMPRFLDDPLDTDTDSDADSGAATQPAFTPTGSQATVVTVWGPTGAPGRTSVAINLAAELTIQGRAVLLIDADPYGGAIAPKLGLLDETPGFAAVCRLADHELLTRAEFERVAQQVEVGDAAGANGHGTLWVLTGILRPDRWPELSGQRVARVLEICREFVDVIVMDVGFSVETDEEIASDLVVPRRNGATLAALGAADTIVAVAESDVVGLARFLRASAEVREMFAHTPLIAVANRVRSGVAGLTPRAQVRQTLERFGGHTDIVVVPHDDRAYDACSLRAAPLCAVAPKSAARVALRALAERLAPAPACPAD